MIDAVEEIRPKRRRRWRLRLLIALGTVVVLVVGVVLFEGPIVRWLALGRLSAMTGGRARAGEVSLLPDGTLRFEQLVILAPDVPGEGAEVFRADSAKVRLDFGSLLTGSVHVKSVVLHSPVFRVSQSIEDASVNIGALRPVRRGGGKIDIPPMIIHSGAVELGEHWGMTRESGYRVLRRIPVTGQVAQSIEGPDLRIAFHECDEHGNPVPGPGGLQLTGIVGRDSVTINLGSVSLSQWPAESVPTPIREAYRSLALAGEVRGATLTYEFDGDVVARAELHDVAVTVPVEVKPAETRGGEVRPVAPQDVGKRLRLEGVSGSVVLLSGAIQADLRGSAQGIPYQVRLRSEGPGPESPFTCTITCRDVRVEQKPEILKFTPGIVQRRFEQFGDPTGELDAEVTISRRVGETSEDYHVAGRIALRKVRAAFERFPYPFENLRGEVEFNDEGITIKSIEGEAPGGVRLVANGTIAPITDHARVWIEVAATGIPIDETLRRAMAARGRILEELIDDDALARHRERGLLRRPGDPGERPVFEPGGTCDVRAIITRDAGEGPDNWHDEVTITLREARLLPRVIPYPIIARNVVILKRDDEARVSGGTWEGLTGGRMEIGARADLRQLGDPGTPFVPEIDASVTDVPVSPLLLAGLPENATIGGRRVADALTGVHLSGRLDIRARLRPGQAEPVYRVEVTGKDVRAAPPGPDGTPRIEMIDAGIGLDITNDEMHVDADGVLASAGGPGSRVTLRASVHRGDEVAHIEADMPGFDLALPLEDFVRILAPERADDFTRARVKYAPAGRASISLGIAPEDDGGSVLRASIADLRDASFVVSDGRMGLTKEAGEIEVERREGEVGTLRLRGVTLRTTFEGIEGGTASLDGVCALDGSPSDQPLAARVRGGRLESPLVRAVLGAAAPRRLSDYLIESDAHGEFDFDATLTRGSDGRWGVRGMFRPRSLALRLDGQDVQFDQVGGEVEFGPGEGRIHDLCLGAPAWQARVNGGWMAGADGIVRVHASGALEAPSLTADLLAVLPRGVVRAAKDLSIEVAGPLRLSDASVALALAPDGGVRSMGVRGLTAVRGASLDVGVKITEADGLVEFNAETNEAGELAFDILGVFERMVGGGVAMTGGRVRLAGLPDGRVCMPYFAASCHGGRITADARVDAPRIDNRREFRASVRVSGVRFASVLSDLAAEAAPTDAQPDESRGILDASADLAGVLGDASSRRGRGSGAVYGGRVLSLPLIVPLVKITNLQLPTNERLDVARAEFFLQGEYLNFESLGVYSRSVEIAGFGTIRWPGLELDVRMRPKARRRIPMFTGLFEGIREELLSVRAEGTLAKPELAVSTLSGTSRFVARLFGEGPDEQQRRLDMIEKRGRDMPRRREGRPEAIRP